VKTRANAIVAERTAELRSHNLDDFRLWTDISDMRLWPDAALRSFCAGHSALEAAIDLASPTSVEIMHVAREHYQRGVVQ